MANRIKYVVPSETVAHLWASRAQDSARNGGRNNFYFEGDTIYSYGSHFPIARHVTNSKGEPAVFFTSRNYSITTSGHKSKVRQSIPDRIPVFHVIDVNAAPNELRLDQYQTNINASIARVEKSKAHKFYQLNNDLPEEIENFKRFAKWLGCKRKPKLPNAKWYKAQREKIAALEAKAEWRRNNPTEAEAIREKARQKREELAERKHLEEKQAQSAQFEQWLAGANVAFPHRYSEYGRDYLRFANGQVETSRHAFVPIDHVLKVKDLILRMIEAGKTYLRNGHTIHLGHYAIESLDENGTLTVGCHRFPKDEILRFAATLPTAPLPMDNEGDLVETMKND